MRKVDLNRVEFHSKEDMSRGYHLTKGEEILRSQTKPNYSDINDILELHNLKKYIDNELYLNNWTQEDITDFKQKVGEYGKITGQVMSTIEDKNVVEIYQKILRNYIPSFWELINDQKVFKRISGANFTAILAKEPHLIHVILTKKSLVDHYNAEIKKFMLSYKQSAEILLSIYEIKKESNNKQKYLPKSLNTQDKEDIISKYLDEPNANLNYVGLIPNIRNGQDFKISDKTRLKAKRLKQSETKRIFSETGDNSIKFAVSISFQDNLAEIKKEDIDGFEVNYIYSLDFIKKNNDPHSLFQNFKILFEYLDAQNRIDLVSKSSQLGLMDTLLGVHSKNQYNTGVLFRLSEMASHGQIVAFNKILDKLNCSLESILQFVFTSLFRDKYHFADNARFSIPLSTNSYLEKVRLLAPEFESVLKQFKLFVEDGNIDFELLQISSSPSAIKDIPSLNQNKYLYFNEDNKEMTGCSNLFFSDQSILAYVEPFKEKYQCIFDLLVNEQVNVNNYEEYQKPGINYLQDQGLIFVDGSGYIQIQNLGRVIILKDLYNNEVASFYHYPISLQEEALQMAKENIILFDSSLFSKPEQAYLNYFLNKSEFTNGLELRNSYLHGTQANPEEIQKHEYAYFTYLKLVILILLKIEDDLAILKAIKERK